MPRDKRAVVHLFKRFALQVGLEAGPGSWEPVVVSEPTPDGKATIIVTALPVVRDEAEGAEGNSSRPILRTGRPGDVAPRLLAYLQSHGPAHHGDILDAMEAAGFSRSATHRNLKVLVSMSLVLHPSKDEVYRLAPRPGSE